MRHSSDMHCSMRKASYRWPLPCRVPGIAPRSLRTGNSASTLTAGGTDARLVSTGSGRVRCSDVDGPKPSPSWV